MIKLAVAWVSRRVKILQAMAAIAAMTTATFGVVDYFRAKDVPDAMLTTQHLLLTGNREGLTQFIKEGGGAWSSDVDLKNFPINPVWQAGASGLIGIQFIRNHKECNLEVFSARLLNEFNLAVQLTWVNIETLYSPLGQNTLVAPITVPDHTPSGEYEVYASLTYTCGDFDVVAGFPQPRIVVEGPN